MSEVWERVSSAWQQLVRLERTCELGIKALLFGLAEAIYGTDHPLYEISVLALQLLRHPGPLRLRSFQDKLTEYLRFGLISVAPAPEFKDRYRIDPGIVGDQAFNCALFDFHGRRLLAYRREELHARIRLLDLHHSGCHVELRFDESFHNTYHSCEDPRLFACNDRLYCSFTAISHNASGTMAATPVLCELNDRLAPKRWVELKYGKPIEKNWVFFAHGGELLCVYSLQPYVILRVDASNGACSAIVSRRVNFAWRYGDMRGSTPPVLIDDEYHAFFHSSVRIRRSRDRRIVRCYFVGHLRFRNTFPFEITGYTRQPIMYTDEIGANQKSVIFPCGAIRDGDAWLVSYGYQDSECWIARIGDEQCMQSFTGF